MKQDDMKGGMRAAIVVLTALLAIATPLQYALASLSPSLADAVGAPYLYKLPNATLVVVIVTVGLSSILTIMVVREIWRVARAIERGAIFTKDNTASIQRVGIYLIVNGALDVVARALALTSIQLSGLKVSTPVVLGQFFHLPIATLICGLLGLVIARAFRRAQQMAQEAKYTV